MSSTKPNRILATLHGKRSPQTTLIILLLFLAAFLIPQATAQSYSPVDIVIPAGGSFRADAMNDWSWRDWLHCEILCREAGALIEPDQKPRTDSAR